MRGIVGFVQKAYIRRKIEAMEEEKRVYIEYRDSSGNTHQVLKGIYPKQSEEYHKAKENGDLLAIHYLHLPYWEVPMWMIDFRIKSIESDCRLQRDLAKPIEQMRLELKFKYGVKVEAEEVNPKNRFFFFPFFLSY